MDLAADSRRCPRLAAYLAGLPAGLDSYPECVAKGSVIRDFVAHMPLGGRDVGVMPTILSEVVRQPPIATAWIPETHLAAMTLAVSDYCQLTDEQALSGWLSRLNRAIVANMWYRPLLFLATPHQLMSGAARTWATFHRGSPMTATRIAPKETDLTLTFPSKLMPRLLLGGFGLAFQFSVEASRGKNPKVVLTNADDQRATYSVRWD